MQSRAMVAKPLSRRDAAKCRQFYPANGSVNHQYVHLEPAKRCVVKNDVCTGCNPARLLSAFQPIRSELPPPGLV